MSLVDAIRDSQKIADDLIGSSGIYDHGVLEEYQISMEDLEDIMSTCGLERCPGCGWWCEDSELVDSDDGNGEGLCEDCRNEE